MIFIKNSILIILYCFSIMFSRTFSTKGLPKGWFSPATSQTHDQNNLRPGGFFFIGGGGGGVGWGVRALF